MAEQSPYVSNGAFEKGNPDLSAYEKTAVASTQASLPSPPLPAQKRAEKYYKPWSMRWPFLLALFAVTCILLGLVELAVRRLPSYHDSSILNNVNNIVHAKVPRDVVFHDSLNEPAALLKRLTTTADTTDTGPAAGGSTNVGTRAPTDYRGDGDISSTAPNNEYRGTPTAPTRPSSDYLNPTPTPPPPNVRSTTSAANPQAPAALSSPAAGVTNAPAAPSAPGAAGATGATGAAAGGTTQPWNSVGSSMVTLVAGGSTITVAMSDPRYTASYYSNLHPGTISPTGTSTSGASAASTGADDPYGGDLDAYRLSNGKYFTGALLPIIAAVLFAMPFRMLDSSVRLMEPFYQLHNTAGGVSSADLLGMNYGTMNVFMAFGTAIRRNHYRVVTACMLSMSFFAIVPISSEAIFLRFDSCHQTSQALLCKSTLGVRPAVIRVLEALLAWIAFMLMCLIFFIQRQESGVYGDPTSLVGTASLLSRTPLEWLLGSTSADASDHQIKQNLEGVQFFLGPLGDQGEHGVYVTTASSANYGDPYVRPVAQPEPPSSNFMSMITQQAVKVWNSVVAVAAGCLCFVTFVIVIAYWKNGKDNSFERFMDSQGFGPRFMLSIFAIIMRAFWETTLQESSIREVASRLGHKPTTANQTVLVLKDTGPITTLILSVVRKHFFVTYVAVLVLLGEVLTVALSNVPYRQSSSLRELKTSVFLSITIMSLMLIAFAAVLVRFWIRQRRLKAATGVEVEIMEDLLLQGSLLRTMLLLVGSRWREDLAGLSVMRTRKRDAVVKGWGRRYGFVVTAVNGQQRSTIDYAN